MSKELKCFPNCQTQGSMPPGSETMGAFAMQGNGHSQPSQAAGDKEGLCKQEKDR